MIKNTIKLRLISLITVILDKFQTYLIDHIGDPNSIAENAGLTGVRFVEGVHSDPFERYRTVAGGNHLKLGFWEILEFTSTCLSALNQFI